MTAPRRRPGTSGSTSRRSSTPTRSSSAMSRAYLREIRAEGGWGARSTTRTIRTAAAAGSAGSAATPRERRPVRRPARSSSQSTVKAVEIVNDTHMPSKFALRRVDGVLARGGRLAMVGGSDAHTASPDQGVGPFKPGLRQRRAVHLPCFNDGASCARHRQRGHDRARGPDRGTHPRTERARADDPSDPARVAMLRRGETVASLGPTALPRSTAAGRARRSSRADGSVKLKVRWRAGRAIGQRRGREGRRRASRSTAISSPRRPRRSSWPSARVTATSRTCPATRSRPVRARGRAHRARAHRRREGSPARCARRRDPGDIEGRAFIRTETLCDLVFGDDARFYEGMQLPVRLVQQPVLRRVRRGRRAAAMLDLVFAIDTTGSMFDDIDAVREAARRIVTRSRPPAPTTGSRSSRTRITRSTRTATRATSASRVDQPFSRDSGDFERALDAIEVGGGNDWPESVYSGLMAAIGLPWRDGATKAVIPLGDAPPHDPEPFTGFTASSVVAAALAVDPAEIYPVVVGGDTDALTAFGTLAAGTGGRPSPRRTRTRSRAPSPGGRRDHEAARSRCSASRPPRWRASPASR